MSNFKYIKIDTENASLDEIKKELGRLRILKGIENDLQMSIKIFINSIYGATGSEWFVGYNPRIAEAITLQGQDMNQYAIRILNRYFNEFWHKDKKTHELMGIKGPVNKVHDNIVKMGDTDSNYVSFENVIKSCEWEGDERKFILKLYEVRLKDYINNCFDKYAESYKTKNIQNFELESISETGIVLAKKKYALDKVWEEPNHFIDHLSNITPVGVELSQSSTPTFAREKLNQLLYRLFKEKKNLNVSQLVMDLNEMKEEFKLQNIEDISMSRSIGNYEKFILEDYEKLKIGPHCPIHVRAAGIYNQHLNLKPEFKQKYHMIKSSDKIRYYYAKTNDIERNIFGFMPGDYPYEFAPEMDFDMQFKKIILDPINRFVKVITGSNIPDTLITSKKLF